MKVPKHLMTEESGFGKGFLILVSIMVGASLGYFLITFLFIRVTGGTIAIAVACGIFTALIWPIIGSFIIFICEALNSWAYRGENIQWEGPTRLVLGAI